MRRFRYSFKTRIEYDKEIEYQDFLLRAIPAKTSFQNIVGSLLTVCGCGDLRFQADSFGNPIQYGRVVERLNFFEFTSEGEAVQTPYRLVGDFNRIFLYETYLTSPSAEMREFFLGIDLSGAAGARKKTMKICAALSKRVKFKTGSTRVGTTAAEAFAMSRGVCQDFAHMALSLCRLAKIPARYVNGLMLGEGESHAWIEVWEDFTWKAFDPANNVPVEYGCLKISSGRDSSDCSLNKGVIPCQAEQKITSTVKVFELL